MLNLKMYVRLSWNCLGPDVVLQHLGYGPSSMLELWLHANRQTHRQTRRQTDSSFLGLGYIELYHHCDIALYHHCEVASGVHFLERPRSVVDTVVVVVAVVVVVVLYHIPVGLTPCHVSWCGRGIVHQHSTAPGSQSLFS